ncbi:MAG: S8 family serine peptidase [Jaaginema sp. PMC 1080.18]|nr:S8 family serine peptidase [Jaaginema sp. PMC 1080.18]MEC4865328.1 S8 family serine peptidase [Jaaginema sp. PMC 1078.18]
MTTRFSFLNPLQILKNILGFLFPTHKSQKVVKPVFQTFILEQILTPSGLIDGGDFDETPDLTNSIDLDQLTPTEIPEIDEDIEPISYVEIDDSSSPVFPYTSGYFTVDETGEITIDYLYDGGQYEGELAIFSLEGMAEYKPGSTDFILEAARRALAPAEDQIGHVVISDADEGARFNTSFSKYHGRYNHGEYTEPKTFQMRAGERFGVMLVPNGTVQEMYDDLQSHGNLAKAMRPLFSLTTANPESGMHLGQIADVFGDGHTFVMEDLRIDGWTDRDYEDIIFQIKGAKGEAALLDDVIDSEHDWRETTVGKALVEYATFDSDTEVSIISDLPDPVKYAIERDSDPESYDAATLGENHNWVIGVSSPQLSNSLLTLLDGKNLGETGHIPNTYIWQFTPEMDSAEVQQRLDGISGVEFAYPLVDHDHQPRSVLPKNTALWHLHNTGQLNGTPGEDVNVDSVWAMNYTGKGVTVAVVDDGLYYEHTDLKDFYRGDLSRDFYEGGGNKGFRIYDSDPTPFIDTDFFGNPLADTHGTSVAGIIAGNNTNGSYGVAPGASLVGLRLVPGTHFANNSDPNATAQNVIDDLKEADSLSYLSNDIDIYNNSWGPGEPSNNSQTIHNNVAAPKALTQMVLITGVNQGRNGLGNIYVWSAGNQQQAQQNVNYDGYANSRYTIAVAAVDHHGKQAEYSERGAPLLVSAYSGNGSNGLKTTHAHTGVVYDYDFSGTSAAAALTSGVVALMLEANPNLTWRDVQHILVQSARKNDPSDPEWTTNGAGHDINYKYGFGVVDAEKAVNLAKTWEQIGTEVMRTSGEKEVNQAIPDDGTVMEQSFTFTDDITVEAVEVMFDADHQLRGDLEVKLISPDGTESILAEAHTDDTDTNGTDKYNKWLFTSMRHWGESSRGEWKLQVRDTKGKDVGKWHKWKLNLHGAKPMISVKVEEEDSEATESGDAGEFTISRRGSTKFPVTVDYDIIGAYHWSQPKAIPGQDYEMPGVDYKKSLGSVTIPAGASEIKIPVTPLEDTNPEWPETVRLQIKNGEDYEVSPHDIDVVNIRDNDVPRLTLMADWYTGTDSNFHAAAYTSESGNEEALLLRRIGDLSEDLTVYFDVPGTATQGVDYKIVSADRKQEYTNSFVMPAGKHDFWLRFVPIDDTDVEGEEEVNFTLVPKPTYDFFIDHRREWGNIPVTLWDNDDKATVGITRTSNIRIEEGGTPGQFTVTRTGGDISQPLTVEYWIERGWWYRATNGIDYAEIPSSITIPPGQTSATIDIKAFADSEIEPEEIVQIYLKANPAYAISPYMGTSLRITDPSFEPPDASWKRQLGTDTADKAVGVAVDTSGNTYIVGRTSGELVSGAHKGVGDVFIAKYSPDGREIWRKQVGTEGFDEATGIVLDDQGNAYVTGWTDGIKGNGDKDVLGNRDVWLRKFNSDGMQQWQKSLGEKADTEKGTQLGYDISKGAMAIGQDKPGKDSPKYIYLTGYTFSNLEGQQNAGSADAFVAKYDLNGNLDWVQQLGTHTWDEASGVAADASGNVYITGHTKGEFPDNSQVGNKDVWVAKYDVTGNQKWVTQFGTATADEALGIAVDNGGRVYLTGNTKGWLGDAYEGHPNDWIGDRDAWWRAIHGDRSGLGGTYHGEGDAWLASITPEKGDVEWKRLLGTDAADGATSVATDDAGSVYITGRTRGKLGATQVGGDDVFVAKYTPKGALLWKTQLGTTSDDIAHAMAIQGSSIYLAGMTKGDFGSSSAGGEDAWVAKLG